MPLPARSRAARAALTAAALVVAACEGPSPTPLAPRFNTSTDQGGNLTVCKVGTSGTFDITENGVSTGLVTLASGLTETKFIAWLAEFSARVANVKRFKSIARYAFGHAPKVSILTSAGPSAA